MDDAERLTGKIQIAREILEFLRQNVSANTHAQVEESINIVLGELRPSLLAVYREMGLRLEEQLKG